MKAIAIDDEPIALEIIKAHAAKVPFLDLKASFTDAFKALEYLQKEAVDLIFLDIKMPDISGIEFFNSLPKKPLVIFTTAYSEHAVISFELDAVDYLLKPISFERFLKAVNKIMQISPASEHSATASNRENQKEATNSFLYFRADRKMVKVYFNDILFIEALKDYIKIVTNNKIIVTKYVLATLVELLPPEEFLRIHKSYIVAISKIESYNAEIIHIAKHELPIGRLYKYDVSRVLNASSAT